MKIRKAIQRIAALGMGSVMVGATLMGAMAWDLKDYPSPFVSGTTFNAVYVFGRQALASDVAGATYIVSAIPTYFTPTTTTDDVTEVDGAHFLETSGTKLVLGDYLNTGESILDDSDLPVLLADGELDKATGSGNYKYQQEINIGSCARFTFGNPTDFEDSEAPLIYLDTSSCTGASPMYSTVIDFENAQINLSHGEDIEIFGKKFTLSNDQDELSTTKVVLQATSVTDIVNVGEERVVNGVTIKVLGANTDSNTATIVVNGETDSVSEGETLTTDDDTNVYIKEVFLQTVPTPTGAVEVSVGGNEITLDTGETVDVDDESVEGTLVTITTSNSMIDKITVAVFPNEYEYEGDDVTDVTYIEAGNWELPSGEEAHNPWVDPVWGSFKVDFVGLSDAVDADDRDAIKFSRSGRDIKVSFVGKDDTDADFEVDFDGSHQGRLMVGSKPLIWAGNATTTGYQTVMEDEYFLLNTGAENSMPIYSYIMKFTSYSNSSSNEKFDCSVVGMSGDPCDYVSSTVGKISLKENVYVKLLASGATTKISMKAWNSTGKGGLGEGIMTKNDAFVRFLGYNATGGHYQKQAPIGGYNLVNATNITQDVGEADFTSDAGEMITVRMSYDSTENEADVSTISMIGPSFTTAVSDSDADKEYFMTDFGTYIWRDTEDSSEAEVWVPNGENQMKIAFAGIDTGLAGVGVGGTTGTVVVPATAQKFADEITNVAAQNMLVIGGPCANAVAATLMGNPANCAEGFEPGKGVIKLFEQTGGNAALLVAGYSGDDTRLASLVVADRTQLLAQPAGVDEIIVQGTSLSQVTISYPAAATTE